MAKKRWPKQNRTGKPVQVYFDEGTLAQLQQLAEATGRDLAKEIRHAVERHLAQPPRVVADPLDEASVTAPKKRGRPRKASDSQASAGSDG
jgi:hypothetical protein